MRSLHYLAFALALSGAQACSSEKPATPSSPIDAELEEDPPPPGDNPTLAPDGGGGDFPVLGPVGGTPLEPASCSVTYTKDVLPRIANQWRCGASSCHGAPGAHNPPMDTTNADATYAVLTTFVHAGKKLVDTKSTSPDASALYCLMKGTCGPRMPLQGVSDPDLLVVETWLKCGGRR